MRLRRQLREQPDQRVGVTVPDFTAADLVAALGVPQGCAEWAFRATRDLACDRWLALWCFRPCERAWWCVARLCLAAW